jgi:hypothetical protein
VNPVNEHGDMIAITAYYKLQAKVDDLQRQLDNARTDWLCDTCEGRGCEAENQNAVLLAELEEQARLNGKGSERQAALLAKVETLQRKHSAAVEVCALARVWATVWHDKLSTDSLQRFAELEQQILKEAQQ